MDKDTTIHRIHEAARENIREKAETALLNRAVEDLELEVISTYKELHNISRQNARDSRRLFVVGCVMLVLLIVMIITILFFNISQ